MIGRVVLEGMSNEVAAGDVPIWPVSDEGDEGDIAVPWPAVRAKHLISECGSVVCLTVEDKEAS